MTLHAFVHVPIEHTPSLTIPAAQVLFAPAAWNYSQPELVNLLPQLRNLSHLSGSVDLSCATRKSKCFFRTQKVGFALRKIRYRG